MLLFAVPNVQRGGVARDSIADGGKFIAALDEHGHARARRISSISSSIRFESPKHFCRKTIFSSVTTGQRRLKMLQ